MSEESQAKKTRGLGFRTWALIIALSGFTIGGCCVAPSVGWAGWLLVFSAWYLGSRLQRWDEEARRDHDR